MKNKIFLLNEDHKSIITHLDGKPIRYLFTQTEMLIAYLFGITIGLGMGLLIGWGFFR